jgi:hypothetical protein
LTHFRVADSFRSKDNHGEQLVLRQIEHEFREMIPVTNLFQIELCAVTISIVSELGNRLVCLLAVEETILPSE